MKSITIDERNKWAMQRGFKNYCDYLDYLAKGKGYLSLNEYNKKMYWDRGDHEPMESNEDCSYYLGIVNAEMKIAREILPKKIGEIIFESPINFPGYDFICKNEFLPSCSLKEIKIDVKSSCLYESLKLCFKVLFNRVPDYFLNIAFDNRIDLSVLHIWLFHRDELIRGMPYYKRDKIYFTNKYKFLLPFKRYEIDSIIL